MADYRSWLAAEFKLPSDVVNAIRPEIKRRKLDARPEQWQPVIDGMAKTGMTAQPMKRVMSSSCCRIEGLRQWGD